MTDAEIVVGIRGQTEGGKVVKRTLDDIGASGKKAQQGTKDLENQMRSLDGVGRSLSNTMKGLVAAFGLRELQQTVDAYTNVQNRLKLVTGNASELLGVTKELFAISNETRQSFTSTAEVYARTALATKDLGLSQRDTLEFTRSLNQAVILSGASSAEASAGLIQLSQGLASGALRGDELRSVLEQLPAVADVIANSLGVTRGELRKMGEDGKITAEVVIEAFQRASGELDGKFNQTVSTISQAFVVLKNNVTQYIGELDAATGASVAVAGALLAIGENIDLLTKLLIIGTAAWAAYRLAALSALGASVLAGVAGNVVAFGQLAASVRTAAGATALLNAAFLTGPLALVAALAAAGAAAYVFRDELKASLTAVITEAIVLIDKLSRQLTSLFGLLGKGYSVSGFSEEELRGGAEDILIGLNRKQSGAASAGTVSTATGPNVSKPVTSGGGGMSEAMKAAKQAASDLKSVIADTSTEQETLLRKIKELEKLRGFAKTDEEVRAVDRALEMANEKLKTASTELPNVEDKMDRLVRQTDRFADSAADAFGDFITGAKTAREALSDLLGDMAKLVLQEGVTGPLSDMLRGAIRGSGGGSSGGGLFGSLFSGIGSIFSGGSSGGGFLSSIGSVFGFASGGSMVLGGNAGVDQNLLSLNNQPIANVGRGEVLSISPDQKGGGASVVVNQTINVSTGVQQTVRAEMVAMLPEFQQRTIAAVNEANQRGIY